MTEQSICNDQFIPLIHNSLIKIIVLVSASTILIGFFLLPWVVGSSIDYYYALSKYYNFQAGIWLLFLIFIGALLSGMASLYKSVIRIIVPLATLATLAGFFLLPLVRLIESVSENLENLYGYQLAKDAALLYLIPIGAFFCGIIALSADENKLDIKHVRVCWIVTFIVGIIILYPFVWITDPIRFRNLPQLPQLPQLLVLENQFLIRSISSGKLSFNKCQNSLLSVSQVSDKDGKILKISVTGCGNKIMIGAASNSFLLSFGADIVIIIVSLGGILRRPKLKTLSHHNDQQK